MPEVKVLTKRYDNPNAHTLQGYLDSGGFAALLGSQLFLGRQRVGGVYFGIITLAVAAILQLLVMGWSSFTGGSRLLANLRPKNPGANGPPRTDPACRARSTALRISPA